jgi:hypothetical protein
MTALLVFFAVVLPIVGLIGVGIVIGANRQPRHSISEEMPPPSPKRYSGRLAGIEFPPVRREPPPMPVIKRRIHMHRNLVINKWQVTVLRKGITVYRSFDTLAETFACAKWWDEHWEDKPCAV